mmetsp:Transcript_11964/g.20278  ORF Transcript_11964/g.20278 Transcript_11964/m.20278 type:complete len:249 (-) Transcript_11964:61-807(-)
MTMWVHPKSLLKGMLCVGYILCLRRSVSDHVATGDLFCQGLSGDHFSDHGAHDSHHGGTSLVHFDIELLQLLLAVQEVGDERTSVSASVVSAVVGGGPDGKLADSAKEEDLGDSGQRHGEESVDAVGNVGETDAQFLGEVSGELNVGVVEQHTHDGHHGNTSMLALDGTTTLKVGVEGSLARGRILVGVQPSKRIVKSQRSGHSDRGVQRIHTSPGGQRSSGTLGGRSWGESSGRSDDGGKNGDNLHC